MFFSLKSNTNAKKFSGQAFKRGFSAGGPAAIGGKVRQKLRFFKITRRAELFSSLKSNTNAQKFSGQAFKKGFSSGRKHRKWQ